MNAPNGNVPRRPTRESRQPFGTQIQKLAYEARPGFYRRWFNSTPGRIEDALRAGYNHVEDREGQKVCRVVGVDTAGQPLKAYLMELPEEWYKEDMAAQQRIVDQTDEAIRSGAIAGSPGKDGRYVKTIKIDGGKS